MAKKGINPNESFLLFTWISDDMSPMQEILLDYKIKFRKPFLNGISWKEANHFCQRSNMILPLMYDYKSVQNFYTKLYFETYDTPAPHRPPTMAAFISFGKQVISKGIIHCL